MRTVFFACTLAVLCVVPAAAGTPCPPVAQIHGNAYLGPTFNLVFVPSGFAEDEMPQWRCAVDRILTGLLDVEPFRSNSCAISAYRVDFAHCVSGTARSSACLISTTSCPQKPPDWGGACVTAATEPSFGTSGLLTQLVDGDPEAISRLRMDLGVTLCGDDPWSCQLLAIDATGEEHAREMASCAPAPDVVVVVANSGNLAGFETPDSSPPVVGITLEGIGVGTPSHLLAHELGHAFDLADEYATGSGPSLSCGRNVMDFTLCGADVPWTCTDPSIVGADNCPLTTVTDGCVIHGNLTGNCVTCDDPEPPVGLWQGAGYQPCMRYRPTEKCRMGDVVTDEYCPVCRDLIEDTLHDISECPETVSTVHRLYVRPTTDLEDGSAWWEMVCARLGERERPCKPLELPEFNLAEFRAEIEVQGIRGIIDLDRLEIRGDGRLGSLLFERTAGPDGAPRLRSSLTAGPARDRLDRRFSDGPVRLRQDAVSIGRVTKAGEVKVRRAWVEWRLPKGE